MPPAQVGLNTHTDSLVTVLHHTVTYTTAATVVAACSSTPCSLWPPITLAVQLVHGMMDLLIQ